MKDYIFVKGASEHNLKNIDVKIPRDKFVVITGLSGSGKSSLAFDTIYAEGQRRYVESLSAYARQFLGQMEKPHVEYIEGLSPAISIDQKTTSRNPRSTVGTVTEIYDYLRLLYARTGIPHCPVCGKVIESSNVDQIVDRVLDLDEKTRINILSPVIRGKKGTHKKALEKLSKEGFIRVRVNGEVLVLGEDVVELEKNKKHDIDVVVDRLVIKDGITSRLTDSVETALKLSDGMVIVQPLDADDIVFNTSFACPEHGQGIAEMEPRSFSFNNPYGACDHCKGLGHLQELDPDLIIPDRTLSVNDGAISPLKTSSDGSYYNQMIAAVLEGTKYDMDTPVMDLPDDMVKKILYGTGDDKITVTYNSKTFGERTYDTPFEGVLNNLERRYRETNSDYIRKKIEEYMSLSACPHCKGRRLRDEVLAVTVGGINIHDFTEMSVRDSLKFLDTLTLDEVRAKIADLILKEINARLSFLKNVGLDYLTLSRSAGTLSGGEAQRIRLATQIGSGLVGVLYILDEPSIGLHQKDNAMLLHTLRNLTNLGNTLIVVEHDEETIMSSDHVIDIGPAAGENGGYLIAEGSPEEIMDNEISETANYLSGRKFVPVPAVRRKPDGRYLEIVKAEENNLRGIDVQIPLSVFTCITGVSGSGKSTLINEILYKGVHRNLSSRSNVKPGRHLKINGLENIDKVIDIDQSPIGRTPRSNPATYTGVFDMIRDLFESVPEAKIRGYKKGRFSFNVQGGRCEACSGDGIIKIEMHFLPDVYVQCDTCKGKRYNRETLEVKYKGKNIAEVLEMTVDEAYRFFENIPKIERKLRTLIDVGLGYIKLGQPSTQLSGGEAQRVKLATELSKRSTGRTLYILDEPTTGLHMADVHMLTEVIDRLTDSGNTVVVIEHNLDVIKSSDYIIDLGPDGGDRGGLVVAKGTPEEVSKVKGSYTGQYLKNILQDR